MSTDVEESHRTQISQKHGREKPQKSYFFYIKLTKEKNIMILFENGKIIFKLLITRKNSFLI